jgi:hypothetical protein
MIPRMNRFCFCCAVFALALLVPPCIASAHKVDFGPDGTCRIDGKPFFPIGVWVYGMNADVMADLHEHRFNTVLGNSLQPSDLPLLEKHGMMCVPMGTDAWVAAAKTSPSLLGWYLEDEPEEHNIKPEDLRKHFDALKVKVGTDHPIGVVHNQLIGPSRYKGSGDFTMTDVYPVTAKRDWPLNAVGGYTANTRAINGPAWPTFTVIQTFGGPDSDGGLWAQPLPHEVRFMAFNALVNRANGILYFSYWPRAPITWASVTQLNQDIERLMPWLLAPGEEKQATSGDRAVEIRAKKVGAAGWMIIATNDEPKPIRTTLKADGLAATPLTMPFEAAKPVTPKDGQWTEQFAPHEVKVYLAGAEPELP